LPACIKLKLRGDGAWLESSIRHLLTDTLSQRPGRGVLLAKMAEAIFIETLRRYMGELPAAQRLACRRGDPIVGGARKLQTTETVLKEAAEVGYEAEAAFNRAFKREFGLPAAQYRKTLAG
jgi:AraC-like DNA-binding protein